MLDPPALGARNLRVGLDGSILGWGHGGIARYLRALLVHLAEDPELDIEVFANSKEPVVGIGGVSEIDRRLKGGVMWRSAYLAPRLAARRPDVFWLPVPNPPVWFPAPSVVTVHDLASTLLPSVKPRREVLAHRTLYRRAVARATRIIAVSAATSRDLQESWGVEPERITVIPLGVDDRFERGDRGESIDRVAEEWGLTGPFALAAGTVEARKGLDVLAGIAAAPGAELEVAVAGRMGYGGEQVAAGLASAGVRLLGPVTDDQLIDLYRAAEVLLLPSLYEGFGLTALEAMACGTPVVASAAAGSLEEQYGSAAVLVAGRDPSDWMAGLEQARRGRAALVSEGTKLAARYRWSDAAASTAAVLKAAASCGR